MVSRNRMPNFQKSFVFCFYVKMFKKQLEKYRLRFDPNTIPNFHEEFAQSFAPKISDIGKAKGMFFPMHGWDEATKDEVSRTFCSIFALLMTRAPKSRHWTSPFLHSKTKHGTMELHLLEFCFKKSYQGVTDIQKASACLWNPLLLNLNYDFYVN